MIYNFSKKLENWSSNQLYINQKPGPVVVAGGAGVMVVVVVVVVVS
jgi:hypothetical protein